MVWPYRMALSESEDCGVKPACGAVPQTQLFLWRLPGGSKLPQMLWNWASQGGKRGMIFFPQFRPAVLLWMARLCGGQGVAWRPRKIFPALWKGVVGEVPELDAQSERSRVQDSFVIVVARFLWEVGEGENGGKNAFFKSCRAQVLDFEDGVFEGVVEPGCL